jgi:2-polyprenyl-3-methyl-5-hydroxy-6-metoxy-1,4-benzoquinol methylase
MTYYPVKKLSQRQIEYINKFNNNPKIKFEKISCVNCSSANQKILFTNDRHGLNQKTVLCKKCGLIFSNPRMTQNSTDFFYKGDLYRNIYEETELGEQIGSEYEELEKNPNPSRHSFDIINSLNLKYQSVCEIGAAGGVNLKFFQLAGKDVLGYEPSEFLSNFAKEKGINVINGFANDVKGEYDLVILIHVLEHFLNPINTLKKLRKNIKKYLFIEVPGCITKFPSIQNAHNFYFSLNTLSHIVTKCGFKRVHLDYKLSNVNDLVYALFEKTDNIETYKYNYAYEVKKYTRIYYKYCIKIFIKRVLRKILRKINPNFEKKIVNIIDLRGS